MAFDHALALTSDPSNCAVCVTAVNAAFGTNITCPSAVEVGSFTYTNRCDSCSPECPCCGYNNCPRCLTKPWRQTGLSAPNRDYSANMAKLNMFCFGPAGCSGHTCKCANGTAAVGEACTSKEATICSTCNPGFHLAAFGCASNVCNCAGGTPAIGDACTTDGSNICGECHAGFHRVRLMCSANQCSCPNGTAAVGPGCVVDQSHECTGCAPDFVLVNGVCNLASKKTSAGASAWFIGVVIASGVLIVGVVLTVWFRLSGRSFCGRKVYQAVALTHHGDDQYMDTPQRSTSLPQRCEISWADLRLSERIGQGAHGKVYRAVWRNSDVAVKFLSSPGFLDTHNANEARVMADLSHPNIVRFIGHGRRPLLDGETIPFVVTELMSRGSLRRVLDESKACRPDFNVLVRYASDIAAGMSYLHAQQPPMIHRDLKSENCLVTMDGTVKVSDFGTAARPPGLLDTGATKLSQSIGVGTAEWMAPEVINGRFGIAHYGKEVDVYSFGMVMYEIGTSLLPFHDVEDSIQVSFMAALGERPKDMGGRAVPASYLTLMNRCWAHTPEDRPPFNEVFIELSSMEV